MTKRTYQEVWDRLSHPGLLKVLGSDLIYTPQPLIEEILDKLPQEVWSNPNLKWLDPVCGRGAFLFAIKHRLLEAGISEQHIVENMLYGCDISPEKVSMTNVLLNEESIYNTNIYCDNSMQRKWNMKFDVIVGNPPFQDNTDGNGNNVKLWTKFVTLSDKLVNSSGYVAFVTPLTWQAPVSRVNPVREIFNQNHLMWVTTNIEEYFDVGSTFSAWIYCKEKQDNKLTMMNGQLVNIADMMYIPNAEHLSIHQKIVFDNIGTTFVILSDETANVILTKKKPLFLSRSKTDTHTHEAFHTNKQSLWSSRPLKNETDMKVLFTTSGHLVPILDKGTKGVSNTSRYILITNEEEGLSIISQLQSKAFQFILETAKWGGFVNVNVIKALPRLDTSRLWTDEEVYKHFNLTNEEIKLIEETVK